MTQGRGVTVDTGDAVIAGDLAVPDGAEGLVLFAHGSGSSRHSPRNRAVADGLNRAGFGTLLLDLLTAAEERADAQTAALRFDIGLLARRVTGAIDWLADAPEPGRGGEPGGGSAPGGGGEPGGGSAPGAGAGRELSGMRLGLFGASTGAAAALAAAAVRPGRVAAVVSRGGRPDLAGASLGRVRAPVLLIVGGRDTQVAEWNERASRELAGPSEVRVVPGAGHLFEEPGALDQVTELAVGWFRRWLG
jgi:putative phosphoribosyl transferase